MHEKLEKAIKKKDLLAVREILEKGVEAFSLFDWSFGPRVSAEIFSSPDGGNAFHALARSRMLGDTLDIFFGDNKKEIFTREKVTENGFFAALLASDPEHNKTVFEIAAIFDQKAIVKIAEIMGQVGSMDKLKLILLKNGASVLNQVLSDAASSKVFFSEIVKSDDTLLMLGLLKSNNLFFNQDAFLDPLVELCVQNATNQNEIQKKLLPYLQEVFATKFFIKDAEKVMGAEKYIHEIAYKQIIALLNILENNQEYLPIFVEHPQNYEAVRKNIVEGFTKLFLDRKKFSEIQGSKQDNYVNFLVLDSKKKSDLTKQLQEKLNISSSPPAYDNVASVPDKVNYVDIGALAQIFFETIDKSQYQQESAKILVPNLGRDYIQYPLLVLMLMYTEEIFQNILTELKVNSKKEFITEYCKKLKQQDLYWKIKDGDLKGCSIYEAMARLEFNLELTELVWGSLVDSGIARSIIPALKEAMSCDNEELIEYLILKQNKISSEQDDYWLQVINEALREANICAVQLYLRSEAKAIEDSTKDNILNKGLGYLKSALIDQNTAQYADDIVQCLDLLVSNKKIFYSSNQIIAKQTYKLLASIMEYESRNTSVKNLTDKVRNEYEKLCECDLKYVFAKQIFNQGDDSSQISASGSVASVMGRKQKHIKQEEKEPVGQDNIEQSNFVDPTEMEESPSVHLMGMTVESSES